MSEGTNGGVVPNGSPAAGGAQEEEEEVHLMTEEELEKEKMRPPDIDQDMKEMERRKRVDAIMNSRMFRDELEKIIESQMSDGVSGMQALQNLSKMMGGSTKITSTTGVNSVIPVADIRGMECPNYEKGEKLLRCKLAAVYRLVDMHGWTQSIYNHITARLSQDTEHFLLNPFGLLYGEVTASSLIKVDMQGNVIDPGSTNYGLNVAGFTLHSAIHSARPDLKCVLHLHHPAVVAVSALKQGLLPLCQESLVVGEVSYHEYAGILINQEEKAKITKTLGPVNKVLMLRNHGVACCGETVEEAWYNAFNLVMACETQLRMVPLGLDNLVMINEDARQQAYEISRRGGGGVDSKMQEGEGGRKERRIKIGELEFEAAMRMLDNMGLRTGYIYRRPLQKSEPSRMLSDVALPPAASNFTHLFEEDDITGSPLKRILDGRKTQDKTRWLNSPNVYSKVEVLETGTPDPKKITKWVQDQSPTHSTPVKVDSNLQFVPPNTNPKEFKRIQKAIKENRRVGNITAGPQSHLLEGVTWEEARRMQDASVTATGDHVILVGAASKGIIQRDFQHNAVVYKTPYAKNPFDAVTDQELDEYRQTVERKQRGEDVEEIEVEKLKISPEQAVAVDLTDDGGSKHPAGMTSPLSDEEVAAGMRPVEVAKSEVPRASRAQPVVVTDDGVRPARQKPPIPTKPNLPPRAAPLPAHSAPQLGEGSSVGPPKKVQASLRTLTPQSSIGGLTPSTSGDTLANGEDTEAQHSTLSHSSKEGSPTKDTSLTDDSMSKEKKKKKKGLRTPSFLKSKKNKKKEKEAAAAAHA